MKTPWKILALLIVGLLTAPRLARADGPDTEPMTRAVDDVADAMSHGWTDKAVEKSKACVAAYDKLHAAGAADSTILPLYHPIGTLKRGDKVTIRQVRDACESSGTSIGLEAVRHQMVQEASRVLALLADGGASATALTDESHLCLHEYEAAIAGGISVDEAVTIDAWSGKVGAIKSEICDKAKAAADALVDKMLLPYKAAGMKGDKLAMIKENGGSTEYYIAKGTTTLDPKKLMKANVWFEFFVGDECAHGKTQTMHRYQFDRNQKLVKNTTREFCGEPPASAYR